MSLILPIPIQFTSDLIHKVAMTLVILEMTDLSHLNF